MPKYTIPNGTSGIDDSLIQISNEIPSFAPMVLLFVFMVIFLGGSISQSKRRGYADYSLWSVIASIGTLMIALPLTITAGVIDPVTLGILVVVTLLSGFWFFTSYSRSEV